jgi:microcystin synthetase protein McyJ
MIASLIGNLARAAQREWRLLRSRDAVNFYYNMGFDLLEQHDAHCDDLQAPLWLNYGHWKGVETHDQACRQLADLLAQAAKMGPGQHVLDCGFGFAEQDLHWIATRNPAHITGINITPLHVETAQRRLDSRGLSDRMTVKLGSATELPFPDATFDCVVALESAFHFDTREKFFAEAFRVLKPGGWLAAVDVLPLPGDPAPPWRSLVLKRFAWPVANCYDRNVYAQKLAQHGFTAVHGESIRNYVLPGVVAYRAARKRGASQDVRIHVPQEDFDNCRGGIWFRLSAGVGDYVIMSAQKPERAS